MWPTKLIAMGLSTLLSLFYNKVVSQVHVFYDCIGIVLPSSLSYELNFTTFTAQKIIKIIQLKI